MAVFSCVLCAWCFRLSPHDHAHICIRGSCALLCSKTDEDIWWKNNVFHYYTILCHTIVYYALYHTVLYYTIPYHTIPYYTILYYTMLYYTILYYTILYYAIPYYTMLYYTILYHTILYYTILFSPPHPSRTPFGTTTRGADPRRICRGCAVADVTTVIINSD